LVMNTKKCGRTSNFYQHRMSIAKLSGENWNTEEQGESSNNSNISKIVNSLYMHLTVFQVARSLVFCVVFCRSLFVFLSFLILTIALSVLRVTTSDYPFDISKSSLPFGRRYTVVLQIIVGIRSTRFVRSNCFGGMEQPLSFSA
jgi:hypothetical protein